MADAAPSHGDRSMDSLGLMEANSTVERGVSILAGRCRVVGLFPKGEQNPSSGDADVSCLSVQVQIWPQNQPWRRHCPIHTPTHLLTLRDLCLGGGKATVQPQG